MIVSLTDEELSTIAIGLCALPKGSMRRIDKEAEVLWKLADAKADYDRMMAESTPLGLVLRMKRSNRG